MSGYQEYSDQELNELLRSGDHLAFTEIYNRYKGILHVHAYKKLGDIEEAKDLIQEMFTALWNKRESIPKTINLTGYLYTTVRNKVLNLIAHKKVTLKYAASFNAFIDENNYTTDIAIREKDLAAVIEKEINALPPKMKEVFILSRKVNLSHKEIADELGISENTVKNHVKGALKILRLKLGLIIYLIFLIRF